MSQVENSDINGTFPYVKKSGSLFLENINIKDILSGNTPSQENNNKGIKGKYRFVKNYTQSVCNKYQGSMGSYNPCVEYKHYNYKIGDVINVQEFYGDRAKLPISEQNLAVPISYLTKVLDNTELSKENISFGKTILTPNVEKVTINSDSGVSENQTLPQTFLQKNKTNLLIAGVLVLGYFAYKKYKN
jgi:hypothetical protein